MKTPQTTVVSEEEGYRITRTSDGVSVFLYYVGRCWRLVRWNGLSSDIAGRANSDDKIIRWVRRALREDSLPVGDMHCTGW
jgi:hypothetical protein